MSRTRQEVVITKRGVPVARLVPVPPKEPFRLGALEGESSRSGGTITQRIILLDTHDAVRYIVIVKQAHATAARLRAIKRYDNRKLYEPEARRYVTVGDVGAMVAAGDEVHVQDQKTGADLTSQVLAQVLLDQLKDRTASIPRQVLVGLIRLGAGKGAWADWPHPQHAAERVRGEAERIATGLLARGRLTIDEALSLRQEIAQSMQSAVGETQRALETRVRGLFERSAAEGGVNPALHALNQKLDTLEPALAATPGRTRTRPRAGARRPARRT